MGSKFHKKNRSQKNPESKFKKNQNLDRKKNPESKFQKKTKNSGVQGPKKNNLDSGTGFLIQILLHFFVEMLPF